MNDREDDQKPLVPEIAREVVRCFSEKAVEQGWVYDEASLIAQLEELQLEAILTMAPRIRGGVIRYTIYPILRATVMVCFYRWIGRLEGWKEATGERKLFPYD